MEPEDFSLDKGDPLYDHIATYLVGLISISALHVKEIRDKISALPQIQMDATIRENLFIPLEPLRPWLENLHKAANQQYLVRYTIWMAEKLLSTSYEEVIKARDNQSQIMHFYRHVRNGVSHGNKFDIRAKNVAGTTVLASWRSKSITPSLNGTPVIPGFLALGDIFFLVSDMNQYLKTLK